MTTQRLEGKRILILEDEPLIAMMITDILEQAGCTVVGPAYDEKQALALVSESGIDVAVLDVNLGQNRTSSCVADALLELKIPFIFATGYDQLALRDEHPNQLIVRKPYEGPQVLAAIAAAINGEKLSL